MFCLKQGKTKQKEVKDNFFLQVRKILRLCESTLQILVLQIVSIFLKQVFMTSISNLS